MTSSEKPTEKKSLKKKIVKRTLRPVASLWLGAKITFIEHVVMKSWLDAGHEFILYTDTHNPLGPVPKGVQIADYRDVTESPFPLDKPDRVSLTTFSDYFRYKLLAQGMGVIWVDMDAYCVRPFDFDAPYIFALDNIVKREDFIPNGVLALPKDSPALLGILDFMEKPNPIPPYQNYSRRVRMKARANQGETWSLVDIGYAGIGPRLLSYFLSLTGELKYRLPAEALYPGPGPGKRPTLDPDFQHALLETPVTFSVHIYGQTKLAIQKGVPFPEGCYLDMICKRHGIDVKKFPV